MMKAMSANRCEKVAGRWAVVWLGLSLILPLLFCSLEKAVFYQQEVSLYHQIEQGLIANSPDLIKNDLQIDAAVKAQKSEGKKRFWIGLLVMLVLEVLCFAACMHYWMQRSLFGRLARDRRSVRPAGPHIPTLPESFSWSVSERRYS